MKQPTGYNKNQFFTQIYRRQTEKKQGVPRIAFYIQP